MLVYCRSSGEIPASAVYLSESDPLELLQHMHAVFTVEIKLGLLRVPHCILSYHIRASEFAYHRQDVHAK
jgi:hypothetical protein